MYIIIRTLNSVSKSSDPDSIETTWTMRSNAKYRLVNLTLGEGGNPAPHKERTQKDNFSSRSPTSRFLPNNETILHKNFVDRSLTRPWVSYVERGNP